MYSAAGEGTLAENFQRILEQLTSPANIAAPICSASSRRVRKRKYAVLSRYSRAPERSDVSNMIQQHRDKDRQAAQEFMDTTRDALLRKIKRWDRFKRYQEGTLGMHKSTPRGNRISKSPSRKYSQRQRQQVEANKKQTNIEGQKKQLDSLFAEAGYA